MVRSGRWQRPARGVVVRHSGTLTSEENLMTELLAQHPSAALAGLTAATLDGLKGFPSSPVYLVVPHTIRVRPRPGVVIKRSRRVAAVDIHPARVPRRTRLPRSVIDAASWSTTQLGLHAVIASSVQQGLVTPTQLSRVLENLPSLAQRALISETVRDTAGGSLSEDEVLFVRMCRDFGLPTPTRQRRRRDSSGRWRYLDAYFDEYDLVVEVDGQQHMDALAWWEDMMRNNELVVDDGKALLRFAGFALRHQREQIVAVLRRFFATRGVD